MAGGIFCNRFNQMINMRQYLAVLAYRIPWKVIEPALAQSWALQVNASK
jgi:hypothetical protein